MTMFILYLLLVVFSFSVKSSSFALTSKARIRLHYIFSSLYSLFQENINANLPFAVCRLPFAANAILSSSIWQVIHGKVPYNHPHNPDPNPPYSHPDLQNSIRSRTRKKIVIITYPYFSFFVVLLEDYSSQ